MQLDPNVAMLVLFLCIFGINQDHRKPYQSYLGAANVLVALLVVVQVLPVWMNFVAALTYLAALAAISLSKRYALRKEAREIEKMRRQVSPIHYGEPRRRRRRR
jgi:hypothetical protein